jgi:hypothetical protein
MINEMENKPSLNEMSDLEFDKNKLEMMRYRANGLSYMLGFGGIAFSVLAAFISLNSFNPNSVLVIVKILLNVFILLFGFLCCEKAKAYSKNGSLVLIGLGGICAARIFWVPLQLIIYFNKFKAALDAGEKTADYEKYIGKTITGYYKGDNTVRWLTANGNFRGIVAILFLALAATCFIIAGLIGVKRSVKLSGYMNSIKESK